MPWYDYQCEKCGASFEVQHPMGDTKPVRCTACGSRRTVKVFAPTGVLFKGTGFYVTDSKGNGKNPAAVGTNGDADNGKAVAEAGPDVTAGKSCKSDDNGGGAGGSKKETAKKPAKPATSDTK